MKANKLVVAGLSLALSLSMVACNNKENTTDNNTNTTQNKIQQILQIMQQMIM